MNVNENPEIDMSELDQLAAELSGDSDGFVEVETVESSSEDADVIEETPAPKAKKGKAKAKAAKTVKASKKPAKTEDDSTETIVEAETKPAKAPKATKTAKTAAATKEPKAPKEAKPAKPQREAARDALGAEAYDAILAVIADPKVAKKVVDKAENLLDFAAGRRALSTYTRVTLDALVKSGATTSTELVKLLESRDYSPGTARAQAQQMMALFPLVGVAGREKSALTLNETSPVLAVFRKAA